MELILFVPSKSSFLHFFSLVLHLGRVLLGIFRNKNVFRNIFRLFCSWEQKSQNGIQLFRNENSSQTNAYLHYSNYSYSGLIPNERGLKVIHETLATTNSMAKLLLKSHCLGRPYMTFFNFLPKQRHKGRFLVAASFFVYFGRVSSVSETSSVTDYT